MNHLNNVIEEIDKAIEPHGLNIDRDFSFIITGKKGAEAKRKYDQLRNDGIIIKEGIH